MEGEREIRKEKGRERRKGKGRERGEFVGSSG